MAGFRKGHYGTYRYKETADDRVKFIRKMGHKASVRKVSNPKGFEYAGGVRRKTGWKVTITGHHKKRPKTKTYKRTIDGQRV